MRPIINKRKRQKIIQKYGYKCAKCGNSGDLKTLEIDHIIPVANGGTNDERNLQVLCYECNMDKRWNKGFNSDYFDINPRDKLKIIKDIINEYNDLSWNEFKIIFTQDIRFIKFRLNLNDIYDYFLETKGMSRKTNGLSKIKESRDNALIYFKREYDCSVDELESAFNISKRTVYNILKNEKIG